MDAPALVSLVIGLLLGAVLGWLAQSYRSASAQGRLSAENAALREDRDRQYDLYRDAVEHSRAEQRDAAEREREQQAILTALAPVRESLHRLQGTVTELERERTAQYGSISEQLRRAQESDEALRSTTATLAGALSAGATRGVWGETQLRRVVEAAGMTHHVDFDVQTTISSESGTGRPDMVVRLPGGKSLAIDAKVPLDAYLEASALPATETDRQRSLLQRHAKAVRAHVDALSRKAYWTGLDVSPEFVICFLPGESLLSAALEADPTLLDYAFRQRVALASPVNLWAVLKTVATTWTEQDVSAEARTLLALGTQLYERLGVLSSHADDLRRALERTVESYNRFAGSLENRVLVTARKFPGIDANSLTEIGTPAPVTAGARRLTAPELSLAADTVDGAVTGGAAVRAGGTDPAVGADGVDATDGADATEDTTMAADLGEVRSRTRSHPAEEGFAGLGNDGESGRTFSS